MTAQWSDLLNQIATQRGSSGKPMYLVIADYIKDAIEIGTISDNTKLPTNRSLSEMLGIDRSTAARAYAELAKDGYIASHVGRGTYTRMPMKATPSQGFEQTNELIWAEKFSRASQTIYDMFRLEHSKYGWQRGVISFAGGIPTADSYPNQDFEDMLSSILEQGRGHEMFEYSPGEGQPGLRREVKKYLLSQEINVTDEELLIVSGSQQGLDLVSGIMLDPQDLVAMEDPSYLWAICSFKSRQARCVPVSLDENGLRLDVLDQVLKRQRVKFIYTIPNYQNPTGITMSVERRQNLMQLANHHQVPILEDNFAGELRYEGERLPSLRALPGGDNLVIHLGTFSKALCPALRLGWLVAPAKAMSRIVIAKRASNLSTNSISQVLLAEFLGRGLYDKHLTIVRELYKKRRDTMLGALQKELGYLAGSNKEKNKVTWSKPDGGMFVWVKLPNGCHSRDLLTYAERAGVSYAPGDMCFLTPDNPEYLRLCFIQLDEETIKRGVRRLARAIKSYLEDISTVSQEDRSFALGAGGQSFI